jgi:hypothetical protein
MAALNKRLDAYPTLLMISGDASGYSASLIDAVSKKPREVYLSILEGKGLSIVMHGPDEETARAELDKLCATIRVGDVR